MTAIDVPTYVPPKEPIPHPFWWPDTRGWITLSFVGMTFYIITILAFRGDVVKDNQLFVQIATGIVLTGLIGIVLAFYMGSSKQSQDSQSSNAQVAQTLAAAATQPQPQVVVEPPARVVPDESAT